MHYKTLRFSPDLVHLILLGKKTSTWRLWDDKNLSKGDIVYFLKSGNGRYFATAKIIEVIEKPLGLLTHEDTLGHEEFDSAKEMYKIFQKYYRRKIGPKTLVKIVQFELMS